MKKKLAVVLALAGFVVTVGMPAAATAQTRDEVYLFKVPIHLSQLSPDLTAVKLTCGATAPPSASGQIPRQEYVFSISNARLDTTVTTRLQIKIQQQDVGKPGTYVCEIAGSLKTGADAWWTMFDPASPTIAFRLSARLAPIQTHFTW